MTGTKTLKTLRIERSGGEVRIADDVGTPVARVAGPYLHCGGERYAVEARGVCRRA